MTLRIAGSLATLFNEMAGSFYNNDKNKTLH